MKTYTTTYRRIVIRTLLTLGLLTAAPTASASLITEYFNDYGLSGTTVTGLGGAGGGWAGAWTTFVPNSNNYVPGSNLTYSATGYSNAGNQSDSNDGFAVPNSIGMNERILSAPLTGTVWFSFLFRESTSGSTQALLFFDRFEDASNRDFVGSINRQVRLRYDGTQQDGAAAAAPATHLILARLIVNASGTSDSLAVWLDPVLTGGELGLAAPSLSASGLDIVGNELNRLSFQLQDAIGTNVAFDALRISNTQNGKAFYGVTLGYIPEPASAVIAAAGLAFLINRRGSWSRE